MKEVRDTADSLMKRHLLDMNEIEKDALRYKILSEWMRKGQPAKPGDKVAYEILGLIEGRSRWPISKKEFDDAIDRALIK
jgi:hypothetical protein